MGLTLSSRNNTPIGMFGCVRDASETSFCEARTKDGSDSPVRQLAGTPKQNLHDPHTSHSLIKQAAPEQGSLFLCACLRFMMCACKMFHFLTQLMDRV